MAKWISFPARNFKMEVIKGGYNILSWDYHGPKGNMTILDSCR